MHILYSFYSYNYIHKLLFHSYNYLHKSLTNFYYFSFYLKKHEKDELLMFP